ncbi:transcription factor Ouib-like [Leguminivora glycinivorella]|uniref:transcription factor Ouib-like n=1 Tax=Leguminivora glycinivorella TaxID=1035111 RepID=UPI00200F8E4D|nr:transcription factor Ouib-like [Leguminivora glycinivorella]
MTESDYEIEYLDEDEDVVQQCVQATGITENSMPDTLNRVPASPKYVVGFPAPESRSGSLLVERTPVTRTYKRKKPREDDDSDYDPTGDYELPGRGSGKRIYNKKKIQTSTPRPATTIDRKPRFTQAGHKRDDLQFRRVLGLKIPNFEDPLCLPVKAVLKDESDLRKLKNWNNLCLNHYKNHDTTLKPDAGETVGSQRTIVLRNVKNKLTGKSETTIWGKLTVHSETDKKSEVFQSVLPKYREGKVLDFPVAVNKKGKGVRNEDTVLLAKEDEKEEQLVVYKPKQAISAVYKMIEEKIESEDPNKPEETKKYMKELTACKLCAPCYQSSWRGFNKNENKKKNVTCPICDRTFISVYNLLAHVKTHNSEHVKHYKKALSKTLAAVVEYHYKCRICNEKCLSIRDLRKHVLTHQSPEQFQCEACNRVIKHSLSM